MLPGEAFSRTGASGSRPMPGIFPGNPVRRGLSPVGRALQPAACTPPCSKRGPSSSSPWASPLPLPAALRIQKSGPYPQGRPDAFLNICQAGNPLPAPPTSSAALGSRKIFSVNAVYTDTTYWRRKKDGLHKSPLFPPARNRTSAFPRCGTKSRHNHTP